VVLIENWKRGRSFAGNCGGKSAQKEPEGDLGKKKQGFDACGGSLRGGGGGSMLGHNEDWVWAAKQEKQRSEPDDGSGQLSAEGGNWLLEEGSPS